MNAEEFKRLGVVFYEDGTVDIDDESDETLILLRAAVETRLDLLKLRIDSISRTCFVCKDDAGVSDFCELCLIAQRKTREESTGVA